MFLYFQEVSMTTYDIDPIRVISILDSGVMNRNKSDFQIHTYYDVGFKLFPIRREFSFSEVRISLKSGYECAEEFLVGSVIKEEFELEANVSFSWDQLHARSCSDSDLGKYYSELHESVDVLPKISEVVSSKLINTQSNCNWLFLEDGDNFHSIFWRKSERQLLKRCA